MLIEPGQVKVRNRHGQTNTWSLTSTGIWGGFAIYPSAARLIYTALSQGTGDVATLQRMNVNTLRLTRGLWEVSFKPA